MSSNVVVLGCGRSGTSILGELFENIGAYRCYYAPGLDSIRQIRFGVQPVAIQVPRAPADLPATPGLPFLLEDLLALVPEPRTIFWQVRDPLDSVCSLRPGIESNWAHIPKPPDWAGWLDQPLLARCAHHWSYTNLHGYRAVQRIAVVSRYEDLVADPFTAGRRCCEAVHADPTAHQTEIATWAATVSNRKSEESYEAKRQTIWSRQDHSVRVGRWEENLTRAEAAAVWDIVAGTAEILGYKRPAVIQSVAHGFAGSHRPAA